MEGTLMAATDETKHSGEAKEAPDKVEGGEATGMKSLTEDVHARRDRAKLGGGEEKIALQHERGKLTARERIDLLVDEGTFVEMGIHGRPHFAQRAMDGVEAPAESSSQMNGIRLLSAISRRRLTLNSPVIPIEPAITVKS